MSEPPVSAFAGLFIAPKKGNEDQSPNQNGENSFSIMKQPGMQEILRPISRKSAKSEYQSQIYTGVNQVLHYNFCKNKKDINVFYVPCYIRLKVNRASGINYLEGTASIECQIRFWMMIKQFPKAVQQEIINLTKIQMNNGDSTHYLKDHFEPPKLDPSYKSNVSKNAEKFMIVKEMNLDIESNPFLSPFELVKLVADLEIEKIQLGDHDPDYLKNIEYEDQKKYENASIEFNFMDAHPFMNFSFGQINHLGSFDIAESLVDMQFSCDVIKSEQDSEQQSQDEPLLGNIMEGIVDQIGIKRKIRREKLSDGRIYPDAYEHGKILIPLYKYPGLTIINVFVPFYMVAILSLGVFFQANDMSNRSASLATFQLAYIAFFPTIRQTLPETPKIVFAEILIYVQALCTLICFFYSLAINNVKDCKFIWNEDIVFLICLALTILNISVIACFMMLHKCCWQPAYNKLPDGAVEIMQKPTIDTDDPEQWWNSRCEEEFKDPIELNLVKPAFPFKRKKKNISTAQNALTKLFGPMKVNRQNHLE